METEGRRKRERKKFPTTVNYDCFIHRYGVNFTKKNIFRSSKLIDILSNENASSCDKADFGLEVFLLLPA